MSKYGYISLDMLYEYAMNTVDKTVSPNEFMRMPRANVIPIEWLKQWEGYEQDMAVVNLKDIVEYWEKENERLC